MRSRDIRKIRSALSVVRKSEEILYRLEVSISSASSRETFAGTKDYLKRAKRSLWVHLIIALFLVLSETMINVSGNLWLRITKKFRSFS